MTDRMFPFLHDCCGLPRQNRQSPRSFPWRFIAPHEAWAMRNHGGQTLERLAERGGLTHQEAYAVIRNQPFESTPTITHEQFEAFLREIDASDT